MTKTRFINPLLQRTDEDKQPADQQAPAAEQAATTSTAQEPSAAAAPAASHPTPVAEPEPAPVAASGPEAPVKFTFYFAPDQLRRLDDLWLRAKLHHRARINKSEFVRLALDRLMEEFESDPKRVLEDLSKHRA